VRAEWRLNPSNCLSRVPECNRRQTDDSHAVERWVAIGETAGTRAILPNNTPHDHLSGSAAIYSQSIPSLTDHSPTCSAFVYTDFGNI